MERDLSRFNAEASSIHKLRFSLWWVIQNLFFKSFWVPSRFRVAVLKFFGAQIGKGVLIRRGVRVHFPWNLEIGDQCWIGEDAWFINHEKIQIASNVCISQAAIICSSGHDFLSAALTYKHLPIRIEKGAWICLRATVLAGSQVGRNSVVSAGEVLAGTLPENHLYVNGQGKFIEKLL
jgi:putative colanic acid biosynthesis acetyltransferase WcaF